MAARQTDEDGRNVIDIALSALVRGDDLGDIAARLSLLHPRQNTFPGEVLLGLAADAIEISGATRRSPLEFEGIRERFLPEGIAHTKAQHHKSKFALRAAAMVHGGVDPGLIDEVQWWRSDDLWYWSLEALVAYVRAAADRSGESIESVSRRIAHERGIPSPGTSLIDGEVNERLRPGHRKLRDPFRRGNADRCASRLAR